MAAAAVGAAAGPATGSAYGDDAGPPRSAVSPAPDCIIFEHVAGRRKEVRLRPGLLPFLQAGLAKFSVCVWTAAPSDYAAVCIDAIDAAGAEGGGGGGGAQLPPGWFRDSLIATLSGDDCDVEWKGTAIKVKPLTELARRTGVPVHRILVVDDTWQTYKRNISNALPVPTFKGGQESGHTVLAELSEFLTAMPVDVDSSFDTTGWRLAPIGAQPLLPPSEDSDFDDLL